MLDVIRGHAQSWGVKIAFGLIILVFVFWGVGSFKSERTSVLATINGKPILIQDFLRAYEQNMQDIRRRNPDLKAEDLKRFGFKRQIFNQMVTSELLTQEADRLGVTVTKPELQKEIAAIPAFQNEKRQFDKDAYVGVLKASGSSPRDFESRFAQDLLLRKIQALASASAAVDEAEARSLFDFGREQTSVEYALFDRAAYEAKANPTEEQIAAAYEERKETLKEPAAMSMEYVQFTPAAVGKTISVPDADVRAKYEADKAKYVQKEQVKARHILVRVPENAPEAEVAKAKDKLLAAQARIKKGEKFEEVAKAVSEGPEKSEGGALDWFERGVMVKPFEDAAFALKPGQVGEPVRTAFGWHLIKVDERREAGQKPFEAVKDQIRQEMAEELAIAKITPLVDAAMDQIASGVDLRDVAKSSGLELKRTALFTMDAGPEGVQLQPKDLATLFALKTGETTISPINSSEGFLFARKIEDKPEHVPPLEQARAGLVGELKREQAMDMAKKDAEELAAKLKAAENKADVLKGREIKKSEPFTRQGFIPGLGAAADLAADAFSAKPDQWLEKAYQTSVGYVVVRAGKRVQPSEEAWTKEKDQWLRGVERMKQDELFQALIASLNKQAKIQILNQQPLED